MNSVVNAYGVFCDRVRPSEPSTQMRWQEPEEIAVFAGCLFIWILSKIVPPVLLQIHDVDLQNGFLCLRHLATLHGTGKRRVSVATFHGASPLSSLGDIQTAIVIEQQPLSSVA